MPSDNVVLLSFLFLLKYRYATPPQFCGENNFNNVGYPPTLKLRRMLIFAAIPACRQAGVALIGKYGKNSDKWIWSNPAPKQTYANAYFRMWPAEKYLFGDGASRT